MPIGWLAILVCALAVCGLTVFVASRHGPAGVDSDLLRWVVDRRNGTLTAAAKAASFVGDTFVLAAIAAMACAVSALRNLWRQATLIAATTAGAAVLVVVGKHVIGRARPPVGYHLVVETNLSYPSGHSLGSAAVFGVLAVVGFARTHRRWLRTAVLIAAAAGVLAIGASRLYLGVHWPTDILAGWLLGLLWLMICVRVYPLNSRGSRSTA